MRRHISLLRSLLFCFFLLNFVFLVGCHRFFSSDYEKGVQAAEQKNYRIALNHFDNAIKRNPESKDALKAAREGARITFFELKDYKKSVTYHQHLVVYSPDSNERILAQKDLASLLFDHLQRYEEAIAEYNKLLSLPHQQSEGFQYRLALVKAQYYINNFGQAESEANEILKGKIDPQTFFSAMNLKGNILVAEKKYNEAAEIYKELIEKFPEKSIKENLPMTLAVCYEESNNFSAAIALLQKMKPNSAQPEYIDLRIKRLTERQKNQPGAKGMRK